MRRRQLLVVVTLAFAAFAAWRSFCAAGSLLVRDDDPSLGATHVVLLMGDRTPTRVQHALSLLRRDPEAYALLAHELASGFVAEGLAPDDADLYAAYLKSHGIPEPRLFVLGDCANTSTLDEARCFRRLIEDLRPRPTRLVIVTSWYHTSRAGWLFERIFDGSGVEIQMTPAFPPGFDVRQWWRSEDSFLQVYNEYLKWAYWLLSPPQSI